MDEIQHSTSPQIGFHLGVKINITKDCTMPRIVMFYCLVEMADSKIIE